MAKFAIPKITRPLALKDYAAEMDGAEIQVWVNPPREKLANLQELLITTSAAKQGLSGPNPKDAAKTLEECGAGLMTWFAENWSQHPDEETHWTLEEVRALVAHATETDPELWTWLTNRTQEMIAYHRAGSKKG
jgi:hypothetical protein